MISNFFKQKAGNPVSQLFRYSISGGVAFVVDVTLLYLLTEKLHVNYLAASASGFSVGLIITYFFSIGWIFPVRRLRNAKVEFLIFVIIGCVGLLLNSLFMWLFTDYYKLYYLLSKILTTIIVYFWNFFAKKFILFSGQTKNE